MNAKLYDLSDRSSKTGMKFNGTKIKFMHTRTKSKKNLLETGSCSVGNNGRGE